VDVDEILEVLGATADAVAAALADHDEWRLADDRAHPGQYTHDQIADVAALHVLTAAGLTVLSEESGHHDGRHAVTVVMDPVDGSTNAARGLPWWATSLCAVDELGAWVALVVDQAGGSRWSAVRGQGARRDGVPFTRPATPALADSIIGFDALPPTHFGWWQFRALGALALDLCAVADGRLDGYVPCVPAGVPEWDYLAASLICREAGASIEDVHGRDLVALDHGARRIPVAAGDDALLAILLEERRRMHRPSSEDRHVP
jgi:fructose-1,6-bisphosphatase/inositol monophosphatase family enzyme